MSLFRAVPTILWVLIFTVAIGLGPGSGGGGPLVPWHCVPDQALTQKVSKRLTLAWWKRYVPSGASWWQVVFSAVVPEKLSEILSLDIHSFLKSTLSTLLPWEPLRARAALAISCFGGQLLLRHPRSGSDRVLLLRGCGGAGASFNSIT